MNTVLKWGIILGLLVEVWTYIIGFAGWYKDPVLQFLFWFVVLIEIVVLVLALRQTAALGRPYGSQLGTGTLVALTAGVIVFVGSYLFTTVVFPNYFADVRAAGEELLRSQGMTPEEISSTLDAQASMQTPFMNSLMGFLGTVITGAVASLVIAIFFRKKNSGPHEEGAPGTQG